MSRQTLDLYEFGPFRLDPSQRLLLRESQPVTLTGKAFEMLVILVERSGRLVEKEELMRALWPDSFVQDANLNNNIYTLRKVLGNAQSYIETVPKHGFRFVAEVRRLPGGSAEVLVVEKHTLIHTVTEEDVQDDDDPIEIADLPAPLPLASIGAARRLKKALPLTLFLLCLSALAVLALLYRAGNGGARRNETGPAAARPLRRIAVLPFKTIGRAGDDEEYLGLGMTDALITRLGRSQQIVVRPTSAVRRYTDPKQDPVAAGRQQGVEAVLDGSIQRSGDRLRVTVQLVSVASGESIWSGQFDERLTDILAVQDSISRRVVRDLLVELNTEERARFERNVTDSAEAYRAYLKGRYFWNKRTTEGYKKAVEHFNRAVEIDPAYALAYAGLADATLFLGGDSVLGQRAALAKTRAALKKAIEIDETLAEPHATLGLLAMNNDRDWPQAEREYKRAIELNPNCATAHHWYGEFLAFMGRFDEGLAETKRAQDLDPLSLIISADVGKVYLFARQYDRAVEQLRKTLEMDSNYSMAHVWLGFAYSEKGQHEEAIAELQKIKGVADDPLWLSYLGYIYGKAGRRDEAHKVLKRLTLLSKQTYVPPSGVMLVYVGLGEEDEAFKCWERIFEEHDVAVVALKVSFALDSLRSDPRFDDLLRRAGFTQ